MIAVRVMSTVIFCTEINSDCAAAVFNRAKSIRYRGSSVSLIMPSEPLFRDGGRTLICKVLRVLCSWRVRLTWFGHFLGI